MSSLNISSSAAFNQESLDALLNSDGDPAIICTTPDLLIRVLNYLKLSDFSLLVDIFGTDYPQLNERIELRYILRNIKANKIVHVIVGANPESTPIPTACDIFKAANWFEREVFDMYGVHFQHHPNLQRILTDYDFQGYPMLKDFPLTGYKEVRYDLESNDVIYEDVDLPQEYRSFDFLMPWEGTKYVDEVMNKNKR